MLKIIRSTLLCATVLVSTGWASETNLGDLTFGMEMNVDLPVKVAKNFHNFSPWKMKARCTMISQDPQNELDVLGISKNGSVNDIPVSRGTKLHLTLHPNTVLNIMAESGSEVQLTNGGPHVVKARCVLVSKD
ncbi:MAG: hypothetical protein H0U70_10365 [Tatlockia sp.]|nr:hypothetical protein [Tatlockia sp.]